jgi:hypothetical protein
MSPAPTPCQALVIYGLRLASVALVVAACGGISRAADSPQVEYLRQAVQKKTMWGEPYTLRGKRLYFTDWFYIRPGNLLWENDRGEMINEVEEGSEKPVYDAWAAQLNRPSSPHGIKISVQAAERVGPVLQREKPWEKGYVIFKTIVRDGDIYRAWGKAMPGGDCYLESKDGYHWDRPNLGQKEFEGSRDNNLLKPGPTGTVFLDPHGPANERFKAVFGPRINFAQFRAFIEKHPDRWETRVVKGDWNDPKIWFHALQGATSPDGIHWTVLPEPFTVEHSDGMETGYYDPDLKKYVIYTRTWTVGPRAPNWTGPLEQRTWLGEFHGSGRRVIGRMESSTFSDFPLSEPCIIQVPGETSPSEEFYTSIHSTMPGAPEIRLMFPTIWDTRIDATSIGVWSSHDGKLWDRIPGPAALKTAAFGQWDGGCIFSFPNLFELPNGDFALPYKGYNLPHKYPRGDMELYAGYARWPKGRIVAVEAEDVGEFSTVAILPPGKKLKINALTQRAGGIRVELAGIDDQALPGRAFADCDIVQGDQFWRTVTWKGKAELGQKDGEGVVIRFHMDRAQLFGIEFE